MSDISIYPDKNSSLLIRNIKTLAGVMRWALLSLGLASIFISLTLLAAATPGSWAQCGVDSYVDCQGGIRCTATDQKGCDCYDGSGKNVSHHTCKEAADGGIGLEESDN